MTTDFTLENLRRFQARYNDFVGRLGKQRLKEFEYRFGHLKVGLQALQASRAELLRLTGQNFNIFSLLGLRRLETELHSPLLAELLNSGGSHNQGNLFLRSFLGMLNERFNPQGSDPPLPVDSQDWSVRTEQWADDLGRLDIVLEHTSEPLITIVIENKINARRHQPEQLQRYARWLDLRPPPWMTYLVYLTPNGEPPPEIKRPKRPLFCLGYRSDIDGWLNDCLPQIAAPRVRETLQQYHDVVRKL